MTTTADELREQVRRRYAEAARAASAGGCGCTDSGGCCGSVSCEGEAESFGEMLYDAFAGHKVPTWETLRSRLEVAVRVPDLSTEFSHPTGEVLRHLRGQH